MVCNPSGCSFGYSFVQHHSECGTHLVLLWLLITVLGMCSSVHGSKV
jgi:hypothetical protein